MIRSASVVIGDIRLTATYEVCGGHFPGSLIDPPESPEITLSKLTTPGGEDVSGLLEFSPLYEELHEEIDEQERETNYGRDPDPDEAYDRWRDAQLERV